MPNNEAIAAAVAPVADRYRAAVILAATAGDKSDSGVLDSSTWTRECAAHHLGPWLIEPNWFNAAVDAVKDGTFRPVVRIERDPDEDEEPKDRPPYRNVNGIAVLPVVGPIMKARSKFGGTSSIDFRVALRKAQSDEAVDSILLQIDSPGGAVAGTFEAANDVARVNAAKPVYAHIEDLGCSGAYLLASQATRITADATSFVGSIGVVTTLTDSTGLMEKQGLKAYTVSTGGMKGAGHDGKVTKEMLAESKAMVDAIGEHFVAAVSAGRGMAPERTRQLADGRVHIAAEAQRLGLIDRVASLDAAVSEILKDTAKQRAKSLPAGTYMTAGDAAPALTMEVVNQAIDEKIDAARPVKACPPLAEALPDHSCPKCGTNACLCRVTEPTLPTAPEDSQRSEPPPAIHQEESSPMANDNTLAAPAQNPAAPATPNLPQGEHARLTDAAIQNFIERGKVAGRAEGRQALMEEFRAIVGAAPGRPQTALNAFMAGQNAATVKLVVEAEVNAEAMANRRAQEQEVEIARLRADQSRLMELNSIGGHGGVPMNVSVYAPGASAASAAPSGLEPEAQAKLEWDGDPMIRAKNNNNEKAWTLFRVNQLKGNVRVLKTA